MPPSEVFINATGAFLPGPPVSNDEMEARLGPLDRRQRRLKKIALQQNGILERHYALDAEGNSDWTNAKLAARAGAVALANSGLDARDIDYLAAASSQNDLMAPGLASLVHGEMRLPPLAIASFNSFCASGMMALQAAANAVAAGTARNALLCASEFSSRFLRHGHIGDCETTTDVEFLRWTLSDGAGAVVIGNKPAARGLSLRLDWIDLVSHADTHDTCMWGGADAERSRPWSQYPTLEEARRAGAFLLRQDLAALENIVPLGLAHYGRLIESGKVDPDAIDWFLLHFSTEVFGRKMREAAALAGVPLPPEKQFTNLHHKGNTGSASIFVMLDELAASGRLRPGQRLLCMVPESGRFIIAFAQLTVVSVAERAATTIAAPAAEPDSPEPEADDASTPELASLRRRLASVWVEFESALNNVPIIAKLNRGNWRIEDYRALLLNQRQQVVEGARWIARAASSIDGERLELRSTFLRHAQDEHRDYTIIESDYVAAGGTLEDIRGGAKNIGSEALSAWMFHRASQPNPVDLLGAMFIIEGLGNRLAARWARAIRAQLDLPEDATRFLAYHGANDSTHMEKFWSSLAEVVTPAIADAIVKTAKVTARLYRLQLEEIGNT